MRMFGLCFLPVHSQSCLSSSSSPTPRPQPALENPCTLLLEGPEFLLHPRSLSVGLRSPCGNQDGAEASGGGWGREEALPPHVRHLLVLATPVDIVILGLSYANLQTGSGVLNDSMSGGMQLLPDPLYSLPTDNTYLLTITSTDNGRIFLAGKDGCLYEVAYQAEAGWFSQRCRKINLSDILGYPLKNMSIPKPEED